MITTEKCGGISKIRMSAALRVRIIIIRKIPGGERELKRR